ncbi:MAG: deoxynucleoside kinase [Anaerolineae bacterium]|nr:deoxynucleoside kinase [Anaerolineae bacterium]
MVSQPFYLAIEGVIGVGKTTLARLLQPRFDADLLLEVFEENPFLTDFYSDRERYSFQTQIFFLHSRYRQQQGIALESRPLIADYTFAKDRLFARLNLGGEELAMYERLHQALAEKVTRPDLVLYLQADLDVLLARITMRDRPYERQMDPTYIEALRQAYEQHFAAYHDAPLLVIDANTLNFVRYPKDLDKTEQQIRSALCKREAHSCGEVFSTHEPLSPSWPLVDQFLALTEKVGALGAILAADPRGVSPSFHSTLDKLEVCLQRLAAGSENR